MERKQRLCRLNLIWGIICKTLQYCFVAAFFFKFPPERTLLSEIIVRTLSKVLFSNISQLASLQYYIINSLKVNLHSGFNNGMEDLGLFGELTGEIQKRFRSAVHFRFFIIYMLLVGIKSQVLLQLVFHSFHSYKKTQQQRYKYEIFYANLYYVESYCKLDYFQHYRTEKQ